MNTLARIQIVIPCALVLFTGCAHNYKLHSIQRSGPLRKDGSALVSIPQDGAFERISYPGSGRQVARVVAAAFAKHVKQVDTLPAPAQANEQFEAAKKGGFRYLVVPTVAHWEDRATEWSGRSDRIEIEIRTLNVDDKSTVTLGSIEGKSRWGTLGGDSPEDMLSEPIDAYVGWLFAPIGAPLPEITPQRNQASHGKHNIR